MRTFKRITTFFLAVFLFIPNINAKEVELEQLQSAFIYKFTNYIEWPQSEPPFEIGVLNNQQMYLAMKDIFDGKSIGKLSVNITSISKIEKSKRYNMLFVSQIDSANADEIKKLEKRGLLIISQNDEGLQDDVVVNFYIDNEKKLRFEINQDQAILHDLKINSRLLHLSKRLK